MRLFTCLAKASSTALNSLPSVESFVLDKSFQMNLLRLLFFTFFIFSCQILYDEVDLYPETTKLQISNKVSNNATCR